MKKIEKVIFSLRSNQFLVKMLSYYTIIGAVLLMLFSYVLLDSFSQTSIREINQISEKMLYQSYETTNSYFVSTLNYLGKLYLNDVDLFNAMYSNTFGPEEYITINSRLNDIISSNPLMDSIYIYNRQADIVFSNLSNATSVKNFYDPDIINYINNDSQSKGSMINIVPRRINCKIADQQYDFNVISMVFMEKTKRKPSEGALIINLKQEFMQKMVKDTRADSPNTTFIIDSKGNVISHPDISMVNNNISSVNYIESILNSKEKLGRFTSSENGNKLLINYVKSDFVLGWYFVSVGEYNKIVANVINLQKSTMSITLVFILISVIISLLVTRNLYMPLYNLMNKVRKSHTAVIEASNPLNEYSFLSTTYDNLHSSVNKLQATVRDTKEAKRKDILLKIINGDVEKWNELYIKSQSYGIHLNGDIFVVCILRMDRFAEMSCKYSREDISLFRFSIINISMELLEPDFFAEAVETSEDQVSIILNISQVDVNIDKRIIELLALIQYNVSKYFVFTITAAIGNVVDGINQIHNSHIKALEVIEYRYIYGRNSIIDHANIVLDKLNVYEYPYEKEKQLIDWIKVGDKGNVSRIINEIVQIIGKGSFDEVLQSRNQLVLALVKTFRELLGYIKIKSYVSYKQIHQQIESLDELNETKDLLVDICCEIIDAVKSSKDVKKDELVKKVSDYLDENYNDQKMSVEMVAELVNLSPNYIRTVFKDYTGKSISNYLNDLRFTKAKELLETTKHPVYLISQMVGFSNNSYFTVAFKKKTGKPPEEYRTAAKILNP